HQCRSGVSSRRECGSARGPVARAWKQGVASEPEQTPVECNKWIRRGQLRPSSGKSETPRCRRRSKYSAGPDVSELAGLLCLRYQRHSSDSGTRRAAGPKAANPRLRRGPESKNTDPNTQGTRGDRPEEMSCTVPCARISGSKYISS